MKKRYRFLIILAVIAVGFYFVWPSIQWYFLIPQVDKDVAESSRNQIKVYAQERADEAIKKLVAMNATDPLPADYLFLVPKAIARYKTANKSSPSTWKVQDVLQAYSSRADIAADAETWYRTQMFKLKDLKNRDNAARSGPARRNVRHHPGGLRFFRTNQQDHSLQLTA